MSQPDPDATIRVSGRRLSDVLNDIANDPSRATINVADLCDAMGDRAFGALLFIFAVPNVLIVGTPGASTVLGAPLLLLALQMILGRDAPWIPGFVAQRSMQHQSFARAAGVAVPWIRRAERLLRPRLGIFARGPVEPVIGVVCAILAVVLMLPIPFGNLPPALAICILALAMLEEDGLAALVGLVAAGVALFIASGVIFAIVKAVSLALRHLFGM